ncbi:hypothetical protein GCM10020254_31940 [Streptomyces goshikiensis]
MPATVEKRRKVSVSLPTSDRNFARVHRETSRVSVKVPYAPAPRACTTRSGMRSRLKWASFFEEQLVLDENGPADAGGLAVLVVRDRSPGLRRERSLRHVRLLRHSCHLHLSLACAVIDPTMDFV